MRTDTTHRTWYDPRADRTHSDAAVEHWWRRLRACWCDVRVVDVTLNTVRGGAAPHRWRVTALVHLGCLLPADVRVVVSVTRGGVPHQDDAPRASQWMASFQSHRNGSYSFEATVEADDRDDQLFTIRVMPRHEVPDPSALRDVSCTLQQPGRVPDGQRPSAARRGESVMSGGKYGRGP